MKTEIASKPWIHHASVFLTNPVVGMPVANDLMKFLIDKIQGLTPIPKFHPSHLPEIRANLRRARMPARNILHARHDTGTTCGAHDPVDADIQRRHKTLHQTERI